MDEPMKDKIVMAVDDPAAPTKDKTVMGVDDQADKMKDKILMVVDNQVDLILEEIMIVVDHQVEEEITIAVDQTKNEIIMAANKIDPIKGQMVLVSPPWLQPLIGTRFFFNCDAHNAVCNRYCLDCMAQAICSHCTADHKYHQVVQIRRLSYHNAIRVSDVTKFINIWSVQPYIINGEKVVFLNGRPQQRLGKGVTYTCEICCRSLIDSFRFCSLECKLRGIEKGDPELTFTRRDMHNPMRLQGMIQSSSTPQYHQNTSTLGPIVEIPIPKMTTAEQLVAVPRIPQPSPTTGHRGGRAFPIELHFSREKRRVEGQLLEEDDETSY